MRVWFNCSTSLFSSLIGKARRRDKDVGATGADESKQYLEDTMLECVAAEYKLREIVNLPDGVDLNEWLASHTISFFDSVNLVYGTISEFCTMSGCPEMAGPGNRQYAWIDEKGKRCKLPAPQYIDYVMTYTQKTVNDESVFPTKFDKEFPSSFESHVKRIIRSLFHVLAHIYHTHFKEIVLLNLHSHLNCIFAHLVLFNDKFKIVEEKETEVLEDLAVALKLHVYLAQSSTTPSVTPEPSASGASQALLDMQQIVAGSDNSNSSSSNLSNKDGVNVITTQCRSISPFFNNNSPFKGATTDLDVLDVEGPSATAGPSQRTPLDDASFQMDTGDSDRVASDHILRAPSDEGAMMLMATNDEEGGRSEECAMEQDFQPNRDELVVVPPASSNSNSGQATLATCSSEPTLATSSSALVSATQHPGETRRSNSSGNGSSGYAAHPYHHYHPPHHFPRAHPTANRASLCGLDSNASIFVGSSVANPSPVQFL